MMTMRVAEWLRIDLDLQKSSLFVHPFDSRCNTKSNYTTLFALVYPPMVLFDS